MDMLGLLSALFNALGGTQYSKQWEMKEKKDNALIRNRIERLDAMDRLRKWEDERYATRYVSPVVRNLEQYKALGGSTADYARAQLAAIKMSPDFRAMSPERQRLVYDKFRQTFRTELEVAKAAGDNKTVKEISEALGLPANFNYVAAQEQSGDPVHMRNAQALRNPFINPNAQTVQDLEGLARLGLPFGAVGTGQHALSEQDYKMGMRAQQDAERKEDRAFIVKNRIQNLELAQSQLQRAKEQAELLNPVQALQLQYQMEALSKMIENLKKGGTPTTAQPQTTTLPLSSQTSSNQISVGNLPVELGILNPQPTTNPQTDSTQEHLFDGADDYMNQFQPQKEPEYEGID